MREYELVVLLHPDLEIDLDPPIKKIEDQVAELSGKVIKRDSWGKRKLAYPVSGQQFAAYVLFGLQLEADKVDELNRSLRLTDEVIRYLLVKPEDEPEVSGDKAKPAEKAAASTEVKTAKAAKSSKEES